MTHLNKSVINIQPILNDVDEVIKSGLNKILYDYTFQHLTSELEKCRVEMEFYKNELDAIKFLYNKNNASDVYIKIENICCSGTPTLVEEVAKTENIKLSIIETEIPTNNDLDNECTFDKILLQSEATSSNKRIYFLLVMKHLPWYMRALYDVYKEKIIYHLPIRLKLWRLRKKTN